MATYLKIASNIVGAGGVATVTFSSIPQTYTDLLLKVSIGKTTGLSVVTFGYNGVTSAYTYKALRGGGSSVASYTESTAGVGPIWAGYNSYDTNTFSNGEFYISNYTSANYKTVSVDTGNEQNNNSDAYLLFNAALWSNTAAITSIAISGSIGQYSTFTLYGISNA